MGLGLSCRRLASKVRGYSLVREAVPWSAALCFQSCLYVGDFELKLIPEPPVLKRSSKSKACKLDSQCFRNRLASAGLHAPMLPNFFCNADASAHSSLLGSSQNMHLKTVVTTSIADILPRYMKKYLGP